MLFKEKYLLGIEAGQISLAFRFWKKPSVKAGTLLRTAIGEVMILDIRIVEQREITSRDATKAGFEDKEQLLKSLKPFSDDDGMIFRIGVRYHGEDPRIQLRGNDTLTPQQVSEIKQKLDRLDSYSKTGPWTRKVLLMIQKNPNKRSVDLAEQSGYEKAWLKLNIRKLKNLGLTISHVIGYEISPSGEAFIAYEKKKK
jgi:hypothetical protein